MVLREYPLSDHAQQVLNQAYERVKMSEARNIPVVMTPTEYAAWTADHVVQQSDSDRLDGLEDAIQQAINYNSLENLVDLPDYVIAAYLRQSFESLWKTIKSKPERSLDVYELGNIILSYSRDCGTELSAPLGMALATKLIDHFKVVRK